MQSFSQFLREDTNYNYTVDLLKFVRFFPNSPDAAHSKKMADRRLEKMSPAQQTAAKKEVADFVPGKCPHCKGTGLEADFTICDICSGYGLMGMTDSQAKWWVDSMKRLEAARDAGHRAGSFIKAWDAVAKAVGAKDKTDIVNSKLFTDIITAAGRQGIKINTDDFHPDDPEGYHSEYYQGHEWDHYLSVVAGALLQIAKKFAVKAGWRDNTQVQMKQY